MSSDTNRFFGASPQGGLNARRTNALDLGRINVEHESAVAVRSRGRRIGKQRPGWREYRVVERHFPPNRPVLNPQCTSIAMSKRFVSAVATVALSTCLAPQARSQEPAAYLHSSEWNERAAAFASILNHKPGFRTPGMSSELLDLFEREDGIVTSAARSHTSVHEMFGEEFGAYYAAVVDACVRYCAKDGFLRVVLADAEPYSPARSSAIDRLWNVFELGFSEVQQEQMIDAFIGGALDSTTIVNRYSGMVALGNVVGSGRQFTPARKEQMHQALVRGASDRYPALRIEAVRALARFRDPRDRALFAKIAADDPAVRTEAVKALAKLPR